MEPDDASLAAIPVLLDSICRRLRLVDEVGVEDVEFIPLHNLRRRIVMIIVCLVVLIPLVPCVHTVEVLGLSRAILVVPPVNLKPGTKCPS